MKNKLFIKLNEIPIDGRDWEFSQESKPNLDTYFQPEIAIEKYSVKVNIRPVGNVYEINASYELEFDLLCSKCAFEFRSPIKKSVRELVMVNPKGKVRIDKQKPTSKNWNDSLFCTELDSNTLNLGEFLREAILVEWPIRPLGFGESCDMEKCEPFESNKVKEHFNTKNMKNWPETQKNKPFSGLNDLLKDKKKTNLQ